VITSERLLARRDAELLKRVYEARESDPETWNRLEEGYRLKVCRLKLR